MSERRFVTGASLATEAVPDSAGDLVAGSFSDASCNAMIGWFPQGQGLRDTRRRSTSRKAGPRGTPANLPHKRFRINTRVEGFWEV
jgi:hypothetical protein